MCYILGAPMTTRETMFIRGTSVEPARRFAEKHKGSPQWNEFVSRLGPEQAALLRDPIVRRKWYGLQMYSHFVDAATETLGGDNPKQYLRDAGRFVFDDGVNTLYKAFFVIASPSFVLRSSAALWRLFFKGSRFVVLKRSRNHAHAAIQGASFCSYNLCVSVVGGMYSALEHAGARDVTLDEHQCRSQGSRQCQFQFSWR